MKRYSDSDIIPKIIEPGNLRDSVRAVLRGTERKKTRQGREILEHIDQICDWLAAEIEAGTFYISSYGEHEITERGKKRKIQFLTSDYEKIGIHAVMNIIEAVTFNRLIRTTGASLKNRGTHDLLRLIRADLEAGADENRYIYEDDISKFYESILQEIMMECLRCFFKGPKILAILEGFVRFLVRGLSIGLRSSQHFGNLLLSYYLDHPLTSGNQVHNYYRYCDDKRVITPDKKEAWRVRDLIHEKVESIGLKVKPNDRIYPAYLGTDFLGYRIFPDHTRVRKRNKKRAAKRLKKLKSKRRRREIMDSFYSLCKHGDAKHLFFKITGIRMSDYSNLKSLEELGIPSSPGIRRNGQKNFSCPELKLNALTGTTLCILDFQTEMSTKYSRKELKEAQAAGDLNAVEKKKYLVCARIIVPNKSQLATSGRNFKKGDVIKFFTGYSDMCDICDALKESGGLKQNKVTMGRNVQGSFVEYFFI